MIVAVSGSLREASVNAAALRAAAGAAARDGIELRIDTRLAQLPLFNPDLESDPPSVVVELRAALAHADAVLLAVPEYAFGIPGAFKNALDWTVGSGSLDGKRVGVLSVAPHGRGSDVRHALGRVLTAINARCTWHHIPVAPDDRDGTGEIRSLAVIEQLRDLAVSLARDSQPPLRCG